MGGMCSKGGGAADSTRDITVLSQAPAGAPAGAPECASAPAPPSEPEFEAVDQSSLEAPVPPPPAAPAEKDDATSPAEPIGDGADVDDVGVNLDD